MLHAGDIHINNACSQMHALVAMHPGRIGFRGEEFSVLLLRIIGLVDALVLPFERVTQPIQVTLRIVACAKVCDQQDIGIEISHGIDAGEPTRQIKIWWRHLGGCEFWGLGNETSRSISCGQEFGPIAVK